MGRRRLTEGSIPGTILRFSLPFLLANLLQALYGASDLFMVGRFADSVGVSAVATGSQIMQTATVIVTVLAMGITILTGSRRSGSRSRRKPAAFLWEESFCLLHRCSFNGSHTAESSSSGPTHACSPHRP